MKRPLFRTPPAKPVPRRPHDEATRDTPVVSFKMESNGDEIWTLSSSGGYMGGTAWLSRAGLESLATQINELVEQADRMQDARRLP